MGDMNITEHFSVAEFESHDGVPYPAEWITDRLVPLCAALEGIRAALGGRVVHILSGYRSPAHNEALRNSDGSGTGVAKNSQHIQGRAADIVVAGMDPAAVHAVALQLATEGRIAIGGLGRYRGWLHVDVRPRGADGRLAQWVG